MFNVVFLVGEQCTAVRLRFQTDGSRLIAMERWKETATIADDIGQNFAQEAGQVQFTLLSSDESDALVQIAPHFVQMASNKAVDAMKAADPEFAKYVMSLQRAQQRQQTGPNGIPFLSAN
jgi:hypothetical protein